MEKDKYIMGFLVASALVLTEINHNKSQREMVDFAERAYELRESYRPTNVQLKDVNRDGIDDIILKTGDEHGALGNRYFAFLGKEDGTFEQPEQLRISEMRKRGYELNLGE